MLNSIANRSLPLGSKEMFDQGSHWDWKTLENVMAFSKQGKVKSILYFLVLKWMRFCFKKQNIEKDCKNRKNTEMVQKCGNHVDEKPGMPCPVCNAASKCEAML